jgi:hypothetical protein
LFLFLPLPDIVVSYIPTYTVSVHSYVQNISSLSFPGVYRLLCCYFAVRVSRNVKRKFFPHYKLSLTVFYPALSIQSNRHNSPVKHTTLLCGKAVVRYKHLIFTGE